MKIGILTFHCAYNFGAMLQCYALQEFISSLGYETHVINYRPQYLETKKIGLLSMVRHPFATIRNFLHNNKLFVVNKKFNKFKHFEDKYYKLTSVCKTKDDLNMVISDFDRIIFGSDQIWCEKFNGHDSVWYGDFDKKEGTKFISYAASAGDVVFSTEGENLMKIMMKKMDAISVRENKLSEYLNNAAVCVLDPTLLVDNTIYQKMISSSRVNDKYILVRQAREDKNIYRIAKQIAKQLNAIVITADTHDSSFKFADKVLCSSPSEFVNLVKHATCIVANSFHGITIAISCNKPFYAIRVNDDGDGRIINLLEKIGLMDRLLDGDNIPEFKEIDYTETNQKLSALRAESQNFLKENLK